MQEQWTAKNGNLVRGTLKFQYSDSVTHATLVIPVTLCDHPPKKSHQVAAPIDHSVCVTHCLPLPCYCHPTPSPSHFTYYFQYFLYFIFSPDIRAGLSKAIDLYKSGEWKIHNDGALDESESEEEFDMPEDDDGNESWEDEA